jgi:hypothetical protein
MTNHPSLLPQPLVDQRSGPAAGGQNTARPSTPPSRQG